MIQHIKNFLREEEGASAVEYGLIAGLIAVALITVLVTLRGGLGNLFQSAADSANSAAATNSGGGSP